MWPVAIKSYFVVLGGKRDESAGFGFNGRKTSLNRSCGHRAPHVLQEWIVSASIQDDKPQLFRSFHGA